MDGRTIVSKAASRRFRWMPASDITALGPNQFHHVSIGIYWQLVHVAVTALTSSRSRQQTRVMGLHGPIAVARGGFQRAQIGDLDLAPAVADDAGALQRMRNQ